MDSGVVRVKDTLTLWPLGKSVTIKGISQAESLVDEVHAGSLVDLSLQIPNDLDPSFIKPGHVLCDPKYPLYQVKKFKAKIKVWALDRQMKGGSHQSIITNHQPITKGEQIILMMFSCKVPAIICKLECILDEKSKDETILKQKPMFLKKYDMAIVHIKIQHPICAELYKNNQAMGRIAIRDSYGMNTLAHGTV